jgi:ribosomal protein S18 acetylase RimI-like enzyme
MFEQKKESRTVLYLLDNPNSITPTQLKGFFVGWPNPPSAETHLRILQGSYAVVLALDATTQQVVGFITAISDGVLSAYIPLLEVLPTYQGQGVGNLLMTRMLTRLAHLYAVDLLCDAELQSYYARFNMQPAVGMMARNYARQSGFRLAE